MRRLAPAPLALALALLSACGEGPPQGPPAATPPPTATREDARAVSAQNLRSLWIYLYDISLNAGGLPAFRGKAFVLAPIALNLLDPDAPGALELLFSPADKVRSIDAAGGTRAFDAITRASLGAGGNFDALTSYAGRRNSEKEFFVGLPQEPVPLLADVSFEDGALVAYSDGKIQWHSREELGVAPGAPIEVGDAARSPILRCLAK